MLMLTAAQCHRQRPPCDFVMTCLPECSVTVLTRVQCDKVLNRVLFVNVDSGPMSGLVSVV